MLSIDLGKYREEVFIKAEDFIQFLFNGDTSSMPKPPQKWEQSLTFKTFPAAANEMARFIGDFMQHDILQFEDTGSKTPPGHVVDTECRPDITAAFKEDWNNGVGPWPFIQLAGEKASKGEKPEDQYNKAISYLHYLLLARPNLHVAQGLLTSPSGLTFLLGIGGFGIRKLYVPWDGNDIHKSLYAFIYRLYKPAHFADPSFIRTEPDGEQAKFTIRIKCEKDEHIAEFSHIYAKNPFGTRTHVFSNLNSQDPKGITVLKDQLCRIGFDEATILKQHVHSPRPVPGVVVVEHNEFIDTPLSEGRRKHRLGLEDRGSPFTSIPTLRKLLEVLFDVLEGICLCCNTICSHVLQVLRYLRCECKVLHRDVSSGNVLYIENSSLSRDIRSDPRNPNYPIYFARHLLDEKKDALETSMLLVDFNLAEYLEAETSPKITRTGTPLFIARAVERGGPVPLGKRALVPAIPECPKEYALKHSDRKKQFPENTPDRRIQSEGIQSQGDQLEWRHELEHDAESVFWLLLYWAMVAQPRQLPKEEIDAGYWTLLTGTHQSREGLIDSFSNRVPDGVTHSLYNLLRGLITDLAAILGVDRHWVPKSDPRNHLCYVNEAFQRLILKFIVDHGDPNLKSITKSQALDAEMQSGPDAERKRARMTSRWTILNEKKF
ncbi:hypothetical protein BGW80DRAFT_1448496 [Lactifluus volemus]|nr:hypothetical protein BGW80DRAFT_1448496 [Lactifluus volemus]